MIVIDLAKNLSTATGEIEAHYRLSIQKGEFVTLFGSSGAGKTTLLRLLAGLEEPKSGKLVVGDEVWFDKEKRINLPCQQRSIGFVFQEYALFPTMSVRENLLFALAKGDDPSFVDEMVEMIELSELSHRSISTLSGGQKQRVALARALVRRPKLLLLDEPLSALDYSMRAKLQDEIATIQRKVGVTTILVSHDPSEAVKLSTSLVAIEEGRVVYQGEPLPFFSPHTTSGKVEMVGEILSLTDDFPVVIVHVLVANRVMQVVVTQEEGKQFRIGEKVLLLTKGFNPTLMPIQR